MFGMRPDLRNVFPRENGLFLYRDAHILSQTESSNPAPVAPPAAEGQIPVTVDVPAEQAWATDPVLQETVASLRKDPPVAIDCP